MVSKWKNPGRETHTTSWFGFGFFYLFPLISCHGGKKNKRSKHQFSSFMSVIYLPTARDGRYGHNVSISCSSPSVWASRCKPWSLWSHAIPHRDILICSWQLSLALHIMDMATLQAQEHLQHSWVTVYVMVHVFVPLAGLAETQYHSWLCGNPEFNDQNWNKKPR